MSRKAKALQFSIVSCWSWFHGHKQGVIHSSVQAQPQVLPLAEAAEQRRRQREKPTSSTWKAATGLWRARWTLNPTCFKREGIWSHYTNNLKFYTSGKMTILSKNRTMKHTYNVYFMKCIYALHKYASETSWCRLGHSLLWWRLWLEMILESEVKFDPFCCPVILWASPAAASAIRAWVCSSLCIGVLTECEETLTQETFPHRDRYTVYNIAVPQLCREIFTMKHTFRLTCCVFVFTDAHVHRRYQSFI